MSWLDRLKYSMGIEPSKLFYLGQEITPKQKCHWVKTTDNSSVSGPNFGEIVRVIKYSHYEKGVWYIQITGHDGAFDEQWFAPVISDDELESMLNEIGELTLKRHE